MKFQGLRTIKSNLASPSHIPRSDQSNRLEIALHTLPSPGQRGNQVLVTRSTRWNRSESTAGCSTIITRVSTLHSRSLRPPARRWGESARTYGEWGKSLRLELASLAMVKVDSSCCAVLIPPCDRAK